MNMDTINNLDFEDVGSWPSSVKTITALLLFSIIVAGGWWFHHKDQNEQLELVKAKELELKTTFEFKQKKAANLEALKHQLEDIKQSFGDLLKRLPSKTEVAGLLVDISQQGLGSGLEFELFKPGKETQSDFYVELPIQIRVAGEYHSFGQFVSGVADLPRIVTQHDIKIYVEDKEDKDVEQRLIMESVAKTYRYMEDTDEEGIEEVASQ
ncbi:MAG: type 4a pilus biogenesis protein PilO [Gammaproteobacteria bacterium]